MTDRCPSDFALEEYLLEGSTSRHAPHATACPSCQARLARMEREGREFFAHVYPATVARIEAAAKRPWSWKLSGAFFVPAAVALAAALLVVHPAVAPRPAGPGADETQLKGGGALQLAVFLGTADGSRQLADGAAVPASAALRFKVRPASACRAWVVSVDAAGRVSRLYPASGDGGAEIRAATVLPGGAVLDGAVGPERIFVFCSQSPLDYATIERAVRRAIAGGDRAVRSVTAIPGLPGGTIQDSVLVEKT
jgi:hypothetical protein